MPVKTKVVKNKIYIVESKTGKKASGTKVYPNTSSGKKKANSVVTARNIAGGHVPGVKPKKRR